MKNRVAYKTIYVSDIKKKLLRPHSLLSQVSDHSNWMQNLDERVTHLPLNRLAIPGSHNSGAYWLNLAGPIATGNITGNSFCHFVCPSEGERRLLTWRRGFYEASPLLLV